MTTILSLWHSASDQFKALHWDQQIGVIALLAAVVALVTYVALIHYELFIQRALHEEAMLEPLRHARSIGAWTPREEKGGPR